MQPEMTEALIVEGFLSYTDLTFLDEAGLMEIIPVDEDTASEMIASAEEWAEEAEEQARQEEAEAQRQRELEKQKVFFGGEAPPPAEPAEAKPTVESVFGPDEPTQEPVEAPLTAAQVFGDAPASAPVPNQRPEG
jgi:N utilization substance protein A